MAVSTVARTASARGNFGCLGHGLGDRYYPNEKEVIERIAVTTRERRAKARLSTSLGTDPQTSRPA